MGNAQRGNFRIFLPLRFYVKSILVILEPLKLLFWPFQPKLISHKIRVAGNLLNFHTVDYLFKVKNAQVCSCKNLSRITNTLFLLPICYTLFSDISQYIQVNYFLPEKTSLMKIEKVKYSNRTKNFDVSRRFLFYVKMYIFKSQTAGIFFFQDFFFFCNQKHKQMFLFQVITLYRLKIKWVDQVRTSKITEPTWFRISIYVQISKLSTFDCWRLVLGHCTSFFYFFIFETNSTQYLC